MKQKRLTARVNLVAPASPVNRARYSKLGPERLTRLGNSNVLRLPVQVKNEVPVKQELKMLTN